MYPNIVTFVPGVDKKPEGLGKCIGSLVYRMSSGTVKAAVHVAPNGNESLARKELNAINLNSQRAQMR